MKNNNEECMLDQTEINYYEKTIGDYEEKPDSIFTKILVNILAMIFLIILLPVILPFRILQVIYYMFKFKAGLIKTIKIMKEKKL